LWSKLIDHDIDAATLAALIRLVRKHTGIAMTEKKSVLLQGRLRPRIRTLGLTGYKDYVEHVLAHAGEVQTFINLVTTNDTVFFRTPHVWDYFSNQFLPAWHARHASQTLKIWSAAAASGEEAYSIAMLCEQFLLQHPDFQYQILGTDISTEMLTAAGLGLYGGRSVERLGLSHPLLKKTYFVQQGDTLEVLPVLKRHLRFAEHNLLTCLPQRDQFDLIFLRNVLIYFDEINQQCVVEQVRKSMKDDARLVLGESETLGRIHTAYHYEIPMVYSISRIPTWRSPC